MPRKSKELRLAQALELSESYEAKGFSGSKSHRFISDMIVRLEVRDITSGQKRYLDSLIDQGVPEVKNPECVAEITAALSIDGMQHRREILQSFAGKLVHGWDLSEKQENFLKILLEEAEDIRQNGKFRPSDAVIVDLRHAASLSSNKNGWYWQHRPGVAKSLDKVQAWLLWNDQKDRNNFDLPEEAAIALANAEEPHIDEWTCNKLIKAFKGRIDEMRDPKYPVGTMCWWKVAHPRVPALVIGMPEVWKGDIGYPCLVDGTERIVRSENLAKRSR
jgi:hypothetical protein